MCEEDRVIGSGRIYVEIPEHVDPQETLHTPKRPSKGDLLEHYCSRSPVLLYQLDGHDGVVSTSVNEAIDSEPVDDPVDVCVTWELMTGVAVRVLINPRADSAAVSRLLRRITDIYEGKDQPTVKSHRPRRDGPG